MRKVACLCSTHKQTGLDAKLSRGKHMGNPLLEKLQPEGYFRHFLELYQANMKVYRKLS